VAEIALKSKLVQEAYTPHPFEFFHAKLMELFHEYRNPDHMTAVFDGIQFSDLVTRAKIATYKAYPKLTLHDGMAKREPVAKPEKGDNKINTYTCENGHVTVTVDVDKGTTPMLLDCPKCGKLSRSAWYKCDQNLKPEYEWYKPTGNVHRRDREHVKAGGLLIRQIPIEQTIEEIQNRERVRENRRNRSRNNKP
jgi:hypothetical protein